MAKYVVTYTLGRTRKVATRNGRIPMLVKSSAKKLAKEYVGYNPRIAKVKWK
ncbi:MAG TPA: hypothetical protein VMV86_03860 [Methanosarcinales archaeon]|nr:hypothetical protein [Methanosarcinales archaeon]